MVLAVKEAGGLDSLERDNIRALGVETAQLRSWGVIRWAREGECGEKAEEEVNVRWL